MYNTPFYEKSQAEAERTFTLMKRNDKSMIHQFPEDYDLFLIGEFDTVSGKITALDTPQHIVKAVNLNSSPLN